MKLSSILMMAASAAASPILSNTTKPSPPSDEDYTAGNIVLSVILIGFFGSLMCAYCAHGLSTSSPITHSGRGTSAPVGSRQPESTPLISSENSGSIQRNANI